MTTPSLIKLEDLLDRLQISESVARRWIARGIIPPHTYIKVGYVYRFDYDKVYAALFAAHTDDVAGLDDSAAADEDAQLQLPLDIPSSAN